MIQDRKDRRFILQNSVKIKKISDGFNSFSNSIIKLEDISDSGIGFNSDSELKKDHFYNVEIQLYNNDIIETVIKIVRISKQEENNSLYGAIFIGLSDNDKLKLSTFKILS